MPKETVQDNGQMKTIYVAGPLFSEAERDFNQQLKQLLLRAFRVYLPQEDGQLLSELVGDGAPPHIAGRAIFEADLAAIRKCDMIFLVLDGRSIDEGAAFELGVAYALGKCAYGLQTDVRRLLPYGNNPMIDHALGRVFRRISEVEEWVGDVVGSAADSGQTGVDIGRAFSLRPRHD